MPSTRQPRASRSTTSASPSPRDTPVTTAILSTGSPRRFSMSASLQGHDHDDDDDHREDQQGDLPGTLRILAPDRAGDAVHHALESARPEGIGQQPDRREDVLERLAAPV